MRIYTDGACTQLGVGGWAWTDGVSYSGGWEFNTTNQRMEMTAALRAIYDHAEEGVGPITIVSDSAYVVNCFLQQWYIRWRQRNWYLGKGRMVANRDLWEQLIPLALEREIVWEHVRGHNGDPLNEAADRLAVAARKSGERQYAISVGGRNG